MGLVSRLNVNRSDFDGFNQFQREQGHFSQLNLLHSPQPDCARSDPSHCNIGVTEIEISRQNNSQLTFVLPMLAYLSKQAEQRWITWVCPPPITKTLLKQFGVDTCKLRLIHTQEPGDLLWISWEALSAGNSHTVIVCADKLAEKQYRQLEQAAYKGNTQGILLRLG